MKIKLVEGIADTDNSKSNNQKKLMGFDCLEELIANGYKLDKEKYTHYLNSIDDSDCVHPFLLYESRKRAKNDGCSVYLCLECKQYVEMTSEEVFIRHAISHPDKDYVISTYNKIRKIYGDGITYDDFNYILNYIALKDEKVGKKKR